jgi:hypothetical protein
MAPHPWIAWLNYHPWAAWLVAIWVIGVTVGLLGLAWDNQAQRKASTTKDRVIAGLQAQVAALDQQVGLLTRTLALFTPGDRAGIIPGDHIPSDRIEVVPRAPSQERPQLPSAQAEEDEGDRDTPEDGTRVWTGKRPKRPTLLGGLAGAPQGDDRSSDTLVSAGTKPPEEPDDGSVVVEATHLDGTPLSNRRGPESSER